MPWNLENQGGSPSARFTIHINAIAPAKVEVIGPSVRDFGTGLHRLESTETRMAVSGVGRPLKTRCAFASCGEGAACGG